VAGWIDALHARRLPKRVAEVSAAELSEESPDWLETDSPLKREVEDAIANELRLAPGDVFLDYPEKSAMFGLHLLLERRSGEVLRLGPRGRAGLIGLPGIADELYRSARVLRMFALHSRPRIDPRFLFELTAISSDQARSRLDRGLAFLA
jgi:hypothetical protein